MLTFGFCCVEVKPFGPAHAHVTPLVGELPLKGRAGVVQVSVPPCAVAPGGLLFKLTAAVACDVQPFAGLKTVNVYVPSKLTTGSSCVEVNPPGPVHEKVTPGVTEPPFSVTEILEQVIVPPEAVAFGTLESGDTVAVALEVQPFAGFVTTKV